MPIVAVFKKLLKEVTWERVINKVFYTGRLRPEVQPLTVPFYIPFLKRYLFVFLLLTNCTPSVVLLLTAVNAMF